MFARELRYRGTAQPSLITQIIPLRHSDAAHHLVICVCARRVLNAGINLCHQWDFVPFFPSSSHVIKLHVDVVSACISNLGFLPAKAGQSCAPLCLEGRAERFVMISQLLQEFATET